MKLLLLLLLPLGLLLNPVQAAAQATEDFSFELTVTAQQAYIAPFNLTITGYELSPNGEKNPFSLARENVKTPFQLILKNGQYTVTVESQAPDMSIVSKVQGIKNGEKQGHASGSFKKTILEFGVGGTYSAREE